MERSIRTAVVTGPTGAVGIALCKDLLSREIEVYAVTRPGSPRAAELPVHPRLHRVDCDVADYQALPQKIPGQADAFFHLAWAHTTGAGRNNMPSQIANIGATVAAVDAAAQLGCRVFVGVGSQAEYGRVDGALHPDTPTFPENGYGAAKLCAGQMSRIEAESKGLDHVWIRLLSAYGPYDGPNSMVMATIRTLLRGEKPALTAGEQRWDYLYAADAAAGIFLAAQRGRSGAVYPLGSGQALPLKTYIGQLRDAIDPALPLGLGEIPYGDRQVMYLQADIEPLQRDTGFCPQVPFEVGIRQTIEWVRKVQNG